MARIPQITRTIQTTKANILCLNITDGNSFHKVVTLPRVYKDDAHILKVARELIDDENTKAVHVVSAEVVETLYGMSEQKFIELAEVLPPRKTYEKDAE